MDLRAKSLLHRLWPRDFLQHPCNHYQSSPMSALIPNDKPKQSVLTKGDPLTPIPRENAPARTRSERRAVVAFVLSLGVAAAADGLEVLFPPLWIPLDALAAVLFLALWGLRWEVALVLAPELIPGLNVFPTWVALALYMGYRASGQKEVSARRK